MENNYLSDEMINNLINDMQNNKKFMKKFILDDFGDENLIFSNVDEIKNDLFEIINNREKSEWDDFIYNFINPIDTYNHLFEKQFKTMFSIYIPCDDDDNYIFVNKFDKWHEWDDDDWNNWLFDKPIKNENNYKYENKIIIYYSQGDISNIQLYDEIDITNVADYKSLLKIIKNKIVELYGG